MTSLGMIPFLGMMRRRKKKKRRRRSVIQQITWTNDTDGMEVMSLEWMTSMVASKSGRIAMVVVMLNMVMLNMVMLRVENDDSVVVVAVVVTYWNRNVSYMNVQIEILL